MVRKILDYYSNNLTFQKLVVKKNGMLANIFVLALFIAGESILGSSILQPYNSSRIGLLATEIVVNLLSFYLQVNVNDATIKTYYGDSDKLNDFILTELYSHIKSLGINDEKIGDFKNLIQKEAENSRLSFLIYASTFALLFVPLWNNYLNKLLDRYKEHLGDLNIVSLIILFIVVFVAYFRYVIVDIYNNIFSKYYKLNKLVSLIDELKIIKSEIK